MEIASLIAAWPLSAKIFLGQPEKKNTEIFLSAKTELTLKENNKNEEEIAKENAIPSEKENLIPIKSEEEIEREKILARWRERQQHLVVRLPEGKFLGNFSAYTAAADECGKSDGITASGVKVKINRTLACPPQYPFGTKIKVSGMGTYICEDRGGAIKGNKFDIYMETKKEAFAFGRRYLEAEVVY